MRPDANIDLGDGIRGARVDLSGALLIVIRPEERPLVVGTCGSRGNFERLRLWIQSQPRILELVELAAELEGEGDPAGPADSSA